MSHLYIAIHCVFDKILVLTQHAMLKKSVFHNNCAN